MLNIGEHTVTTPLKKALHRAQGAYRLMLTRGIVTCGLSRTGLHPCGWLWDDRSTGTNLLIHLKPNGAYLKQEVGHASFKTPQSWKDYANGSV